MNNKTYKYSALALLMSVAGCNTAFAQKISVESFSIGAGQTKTVPVMLQDDNKKIQGIQATLTFPADGYTVTASAVEGCMGEVAPQCLINKTGDNTYALAIYSFEEGASFNINGEEAAAIINLSITAPAEVADNVKLQISDIAFGVVGEDGKLSERSQDNAEVNFSVVEVLSDGKYYLKNVASGKFWGAGNSWGTQASLLKNPNFVTLIANEDGTYKIESQVSNGGNNIYFNGDFMDNDSPVALTIAKVDDYYTIANGDNYFGYDGESTVLGKNLAADAEVALWQIISEEDMLASLATATQEAPVDATFLLSDANFGRNNRYYNAWTFDASNQNNAGDVTNYCVESYHSLFTLNQTIANAPAGVYKLTAQGFYRQDGTDNEHLPVFYLNDETATFPFLTGAENSMTDASGAFTAGKYVAAPIYLELAEAGDLSVGAKLEGNTSLWCIWDNFELTYYGTEANLVELKLGALVQQLEDLRKDAQELADDPEALTENLVAALEKALDDTKELEATEEAYEAGAAELSEAIGNAKDYKDKKVAVDANYDILNSTNFYTQEAYDAYKSIIDEWNEKLEAGALDEKVVNPSIAGAYGWHASNPIDDYLLSAWTIGGEQAKDYDKALYINTWSVEGDRDGSGFGVPFYEYWVPDANSLGVNTIAATVEGLEPGIYDVTVLARVRLKDGAETPATGIAFSANGDDPVEFDDAAIIGNGPLYLKEISTTVSVGKDGVLTVKFDVLEDNNVSWLAFKNVTYVKNNDPSVAISNVDKAAVLKNGKFLENSSVVIIKNGKKFNVAGQAIK